MPTLLEILQRQINQNVPTPSPVLQLLSTRPLSSVAISAYVAWAVPGPCADRVRAAQRARLNMQVTCVYSAGNRAPVLARPISTLNPSFTPYLPYSMSICCMDRIQTVLLHPAEQQLLIEQCDPCPHMASLPCSRVVALQ